MKRKAKDLTDKERMRTLDMLYTAASSVRGRDAVKLFLRDLLTESERIMLGRRVWIARLLLKGEKYDVIAAKLKLSYKTIYKVARWLEDQLPGYEQAIKGMEKEFKGREKRFEIEYGPFSFRAMKRKYPLHFLLFPEPKKKKIG
ncbi:MAG: Trp family transcriptional regulator [Patescibacteria group bacterium]